MKQSGIIFFVLLLAGMISFPAYSQDKHKHHSCSDSTSFGMQGVTIRKIGKDSMVVYVSKKEITNWHEWPPRLFSKKGKYNGHWAGVELGINGYVNDKFNMNFDPEYAYMNMNTARSMVVNLNPFEFNVNIAKNKFGFTSGLGFQLSNYYFTGSYVMIPDSSQLVAYKIKDGNGNYVGLKQDKLFVSYLNIPLLFEFQTNPKRNLKSFHVSVGVIGGVRICSYTKQKYNSIDQTYYLVDDKGARVASYYVGDNVVRSHGAYHLSPFKLDASFRIGWSFLNLFATYSLTPMFQDNQGPKLYPWAVGITLLGF
ncbi:MAG: outer membrane beta-barrel protein [Bacteroidota bacterium]